MSIASIEDVLKARGMAAADRQYVFDVPLAQVTSNAIRGFDAYWQSKASGGNLPTRADIEPFEIKTLLPDIVLLDVEWEPFRCRVRLRGTRAEQFRPKGDTKYLDEAKTFAPGRKEDYMAEMQFVANERRPAFALDWMISRQGHLCDIWAGIWPLSMAGERTNMLVVIEDFAGLVASDFDLKAG